jgi:hypothetical protein
MFMIARRVILCASGSIVINVYVYKCKDVNVFLNMYCGCLYRLVVRHTSPYLQRWTRWRYPKQKGRRVRTCRQGRRGR